MYAWDGWCWFRLQPEGTAAALWTPLPAAARSMDASAAEQLLRLSTNGQQKLLELELPCCFYLTDQLSCRLMQGANILIKSTVDKPVRHATQGERE